MTSIDMLGHFGYLWILTGMLLLAQKSDMGWPVRLIGEAIWLVVGLILGMSSIWFWGIIFMFLDAYGWWKWRR